MSRPTAFLAQTVFLAVVAAVPAAGIRAAELRAAETTRTPAPRERAGSPGSHTDFSGLWQIDSAASAGGAHNMEGAVLEVTQKEDRIWIQPGGESMGRRVLAEELVVDGRSYEKALGGNGGKGTVVAKWGTDAMSLWIEVTSDSEDTAHHAVQRSVWRLSHDRSTWVRESMTIQDGGAARQSRLVFRRQKPDAPEKTPTAKPKAGRKAAPAKP